MTKNMTSFTSRFTAMLWFICLFLLFPRAYAQTPDDGLYIGTSSTIAGQNPVHTNTGTPYATPRALEAGTTTYVLQRGSGNYTISGVISGSGNLVIDVGSTDTLILTGNNTYTGTTTITSGTLQIGNGTGSGRLGMGIVINNSALIFNRSDDVTWLQVISGTGTMTKKGLGTLTMDGLLNYTGFTTVESDTLKIKQGTSAITVRRGAALELYGSTARVHLFPLILEDGSTLVKSSTNWNDFRDHDVTVTGHVKIKITNMPSGFNNQQLYVGGSRTGFRGSGTVTIDNTSGSSITGLTLRGTGLDHFSGTLMVQDGKLGLGNSIASLALDRASIRLEGTAVFAISDVTSVTAIDASLKSLNGVEGTEVHIGAYKTLTLGTTNGKSIYAGEISGDGGLKKVGTDTVELSGANTYSGPSRVEQGVLEISGSLSSTSLVTVEGGALGGKGTVQGSVTLKSAVGSALYGGTRSGRPDTIMIGGMLRGEQGGINVYASGSGAELKTSLVEVGSATGQVVVNLRDPIVSTRKPDTLTIIKCTHDASSMIARIGVNRSGYGARAVWKAGEGLQLVVGLVSILYQNSKLLTSSASYASDIILQENSVFTEVSWTSNVTHELSGIISGDYGIEIQLDTLVLTGENSYTDTTTITQGVLQIGKGASSGKLGTGSVVHLVSSTASELIFHRSDSVTVSNPIIGLGKLVQMGSGTLTLDGDKAYTGPTEVKSGELVVQGKLSSSVIMLSGGVLSGTDTVTSVELGRNSELYGGSPTTPDTLFITGTLKSSGGHVNVYNSGSGSTTKTSLIKAGKVLGTIVVNIEGVLPIGTHTLISCADRESRLEPTLGRNSSRGCVAVALSWKSGVGLQVVVSASALSATISGEGRVERGAAPGPKITLTGSGGTAPYIFTYKIGQGAEKTINSEGNSSTAELMVQTSTVATYVYTLVKVRDSGVWNCDQSVTGQQVTVIITDDVTGDLPKPGESLHLYPVPAQDQIVIRSSKVLGRVQLRDLQGRVLLEREPSSSRELELSIADLPVGIYVVEVEEGQHLRRVKLSKE